MLDGISMTERSFRQWFYHRSVVRMCVISTLKTEVVQLILVASPELPHTSMVTRLAKSIDGIRLSPIIMHSASQVARSSHFLMVPHPLPSITTYSQSIFLFVVAEDYTWLIQCVGAPAIAPVFRD